MKNLIILFIAGFLSISVYGQRLEITDTFVKHNNQSRPCIEVKIEPKTKMVRKEWDEYLKSNYNINLKGMGWFGGKDILYAENIIIESISSNPISIYSKITKDEEGTTMCVFSSVNENSYIDSQNYQQEYASIKNMISGFVNTFLPKYYQQEVEDIEGESNKIEKKLKSLEDDIKNNEEDIIKNQSQNEKLNKSNEKLREEIKLKNQELQKKQDLLKERKDKLEKIREKLIAYR